MTTPLDALIQGLRKAGTFDRRVEAPPEAILWCDPNDDFAPLLPTLRSALPNFLTLGDYDRGLRRGPAIWLRAAAGCAIGDLAWDTEEAERAPAIIYLPGVGREVLRAAEDCPEHLRLLAWFMVSGSAFGHTNSRDWTLRGFLSSKPAYGGLGLDVAQDEATREALVAAAPKLFRMSVEELREYRLDAPRLHAIVAPDLEDDALAWLGGELTAESDPQRFAAFRARAQVDLKTDVAKIAPPTAAERMLRGDNKWKRVWSRFANGSRGSYDAAAGLLAGIEPRDFLSADPTIYATANARQEAALRKALLGLKDSGEVAACDSVVRLAEAHADRVQGPWAKRLLAPLAEAVQYLARIATTPPLPLQSPEKLAEAYADTGWTADDAALRALEAVAPARLGALLPSLEADRDAVVAALRAVYAPRVEREASALQTLLSAGPPKPAKPEETDAILFIDGLRMDVAHRLKAIIEGAGAEVMLGWRWTGFPSVTATCKPLASPAADRFSGSGKASDFEPSAQDGKPVDHAGLMGELEKVGWSVGETVIPSEKCWIEAGSFDKNGHARQSRMVEDIEAELSVVASRALRLVASGRKVRITTDHGWLLLPGSLPVAKLPAGLTETRWRRCAVVKDGAAVTATRLPWSWNHELSVAIAPGSHVFVGGEKGEYAHGGISPQESIVPEMVVMPSNTIHRARIADVKWDGLRIRLRVEHADGAVADLKLGADGDGPSIVDKPRELDAEGRTSLLVPDDTLEGRPAMLELRGPDGRVSATLGVVVGG